MMGRQINILIKIVMLLATVSAVGCMVGPDFQKPEMYPPPYFRTAELTAETEVNLKWWELFNDPVLHTLIAAALENNKDVRIAASRIQEARAALGFARADLLPRIDLDSEARRGNTAGKSKKTTETPKGTRDITDENYFGAAALSWEIDFWGKFRRATEAARAELMASEYSLRAVQISLIAEVATTYYQLLDYHQRLDISQRTLESRRESLDIIEKRFGRGVIPEIDVNQAQIQKETAAAAIPVYERLISKTENAISILLGRYSEEITKVTDLQNQSLPPEIPAGLPSFLLERRPDIVEAEYGVQAQNAKIGIAQALRLPAISLTGFAGRASDEISSLSSDGTAWSIAGSIVGPIFNFNQDKMRVEIEKERTKQALYRYEKTVLSACREVEDALIEIQTYKEQIGALKRKYTAAKNANRLSKMRYDKGITSFLEVLDIERELFEVALEHSEVRQQYQNSYVALYKALGGGWLSRDESRLFEKTSDDLTNQSD